MNNWTRSQEVCRMKPVMMPMSAGTPMPTSRSRLITAVR
jgi:hypothetical protein